MDPLTAFGLFAVSAMLVCYALEERSLLVHAVSVQHTDSSKAHGRLV
jgi:hypothetical protein